MSQLTRRGLLRAGAAGASALYLPFAADARSAFWQARAARRRVSQRALQELWRALRGGLLLPGDPAYDVAMTPANARYDGIKPVAVAQCVSERDVVTCVNWACAHGVPPVVRGGGHSYAGYSMTDGLMIDLGLMTRVDFNRRTGVAVMDGAAKNQNVFNATVNSKYVLPGGTCLAVGVGGLVLGGGVGYNTHWAGLTSDHLVGSRLVTADGRVRQVDPAHHPDLFWACRGGAGGSFGVNTQFTFHLQRIPRADVAFYRFDWRGADAAGAVLGAFEHVLAKAPAALNAVAQAQAVPVQAGENKRDAVTVFSRGQYIGPLSELKELVQPLIAAAGPPVKTQLETFKYWDMQRMFASAEAERHGFGDLSRYASKPLPDVVHAKLADLLANCPSRDAASNGSMWSLGWVGGPVVDSFRPRDTAYVHRDMLTMLRATPVWALDAPRSVQDGLLSWTNQMIDVIRPFTPNQSYQNFPNRGIKDWPQQYYGENYARLVKVKTKYDPHNLFHNPQSIRPRRTKRD
jgi:FAD/FMN-containing dehydrogenase